MNNDKQQPVAIGWGSHITMLVFWSSCMATSVLAIIMFWAFFEGPAFALLFLPNLMAVIGLGREFSLKKYGFRD